MQFARFSHRQQLIKRLFDLAVTVPVFIVAAPIIGVAALLVKAVSPGPAFFSQKREGLNGEDVRIWKIRTMVPDAEKKLAQFLASDPAARFEYERTLKLRNDPRVIPKIGNFLRRASIDELPQLWSVLRGDMSLVGPRIMPANEVNRYSEEGQELRRNVLPGLTGFWQIMYRNNSDLRIREVADSYYVNNWSVWLDSWILFRTVRVVFGGSGAF
jgi:lipopolysaccharide/colanic/teichoic acid biosynthesis glycosyltransferase